MDKRLFRFGFLAHDHDHAPSPDWSQPSVHWSVLEFEGLTVHLHPETESRIAADVLFIGDVHAIRGTVEQAAIDRNWDDLSGRFAAIWNDGALRILHDAFGARTIFWRRQGGAVASHSEILALAYGHIRCPDMREFVVLPEYKARNTKYLPGLRTIYSDVLALPPNHHYNFSTGNIRRFWPTVECQPSTFDQFVDEMKITVAALARSVPNPVIGITGGIDTRVLAVEYARSSVPFKAITWSEPWIKPNERPIIQRTIDILGLDHSYLAMTGSIESPTARLAGRNSGGFRGRSKLTDDMMTNLNEGTFIRGYGGEIIRGFYNLTSHNKLYSATPSEMLKAYGSSMKPVEVGERYMSIGLDAFSELCEMSDYSDLKGYGLSDVFYWEHRMGIWGAAMHNEMDAAVKSITGMNSRRLYEVGLGLPEDERLSKDLLHRLTARSIPAMAKVPYL
ncbi:hypothetical protein [Aliihoeflea sp. 2WW]|uniref:hypothetical protein n=1 Tax=Aliihoeflea sp. 2WW TaxID=1381123 RepID=UPI0004AF925C|nr:hypothetical protein [Aliihoeflea sp. 2WW]